MSELDTVQRRVNQLRAEHKQLTETLNDDRQVTCYGHVQRLVSRQVIISDAIKQLSKEAKRLADEELDDYLADGYSLYN